MPIGCGKAVEMRLVNVRGEEYIYDWEHDEYIAYFTEDEGLRAYGHSNPELIEWDKRRETEEAAREGKQRVA